MEISPTLLQEGLEGIQTLLTWVAAASGAYLVLTTTRIRIRIRRSPVPTSRGSLLGGLGLVLAFSGVVRASEASGRIRSPRPVVQSESPPWSEPGGFTPPHPPGSTTRGHPAVHHRDRVHPAIHRSARAPAERLFPRARGNTYQLPRARDDARDHPRDHPASGDLARDDLARSMECHPAGKARPRTKYVVQPGDTLWDIAARTLQTSDVRRIARFWPNIHRINRDAIGRDPNRLFPGQLLRLPDETR